MRSDRPTAEQRFTQILYDELPWDRFPMGSRDLIHRDVARILARMKAEGVALAALRAERDAPELTDEQVDRFMLTLCDAIAERVGEAPIIGYTPDEVRAALRVARGVTP